MHRWIIGPTLSQTMGKDGAPTVMPNQILHRWIIGPTLSQKMEKDWAPTSMLNQSHTLVSSRS